MKKKSTENQISELKKEPRVPILLILDSGKNISPLFINLIYDENIKFIDTLYTASDCILCSRNRKKRKKELS